jgi:hypothetical protein
MAGPSSGVLGVIVHVDSSGGSPRLTIDSIGVCNFVSRMGGGVSMLTLCLVSSFNELCMTCEVGCDWVGLRLSRARCLRRMALLRSVRMSL